MRPSRVLPLLVLACGLAAAGAIAQDRTGARVGAPLSSALDAGTTVSGVVAEGKPTLHTFLALRGDVVALTLRGPGAVELALYGPDGERISGLGGQDIAHGQVTLAADGPHFLAVFADPGTRYSITLKRVVAARIRPGIDPGWGVYAQLAGRRADFDGGARIEWTWDVAGEALVERQFEPDGRTILYTACIVRAPNAPHLSLVAADLTWHGDVSLTDGSVLWRFGKARRGYARTELPAEDTLHMTYVEGTERKSVGRLSAQGVPPASSPGAQAPVCPRAGAIQAS